jgi:hypothetical protein
MESREKSATPVATPLGTRASSSAQSRHCDQSMSVDPHQVASRGTNPRFGAVQCGHRQQVARLRCRRPQGRGRCSKWICVWIFSGSSAGGSHIRVDRLPGLLRQFETDGLALSTFAALSTFDAQLRVQAAVNWLCNAGAVAPRNPIVGSFPACCARATSGQGATAPPSSVMNSRRSNRSSDIQSSHGPDHLRQDIELARIGQRMHWLFTTRSFRKAAPCNCRSLAEGLASRQCI